jgi:putative PIN family toxin of toxin-antitoxin system
VLWVVVFDTNILISAQLSLHGAPARCLALARTRNVRSITCVEILDEFREKLVYKFNYSRTRAQEAVDAVLAYSDVVTLAASLTVVQNDPTDNKIIECAVTGGATHIVSGDKRHLLSLGRYEDIAIVSAAGFLSLVAGDA